MGNIRNKDINLFVQKAKLLNLFPDSKILIHQNSLLWKFTLKPTPMSDYYDIKLEYKIGFHPSVYIINKKLKLYPGEKKLPHVYDTETQCLCLYYKKAHEWKSQMFISETIAPWISEWLFHYEFWLVTGTWHGKGIHGKIKPFRNNKIN